MQGIFKAQVKFTESPETILDLDFEPIIREFDLHKLSKFVLCHWQSKPKGIRGYGFYDWYSKKYHCIDWDKILIPKTGIKCLQIDESIYKSAPTAALLFPNSQLFKSNDLVLIR